MEVVALVPDIEPLLFSVEARLVLAEVVKVDEAVRAVAFGAPVVTVEFAAADALATTLLLPCELEGLEVGAFVRPIAPRLRLAVAAGAPEVSLALLHLDLVTALLRHVGQLRGVQVSLVRDVGQIF